MRYMLDTDICRYLIRKHPTSVFMKMDEAVEQGHEIIISSITYAALMLGARRSNRADKLITLINYLCERLHEVCAWDYQAADEFAEVQTYLLSQGSPIGGNDTLIAAHALRLEAILVTNNVRHFSRVPNLQIENWAE